MRRVTRPVPVSRWLALAGALAIVAAFAPALAGGTLVGADLGTFSLPQHRLLAGLLREGRLPGWNPFLGHGGPLWADASFAPLYPGNVLLLLLDPLTALNVGFVLHLGLALVGTFLLARALGVSPPGALVAGAAFALGGPVVSYVEVPIYVSALAWVPWQVLLVRRALEPGAPPRRAVIAGLPFALCFLTAGAELCPMGFLLGLALAPPGARPGPGALRAGLIVVAALGLAAPGLAPLLHALPDTDRSLRLPYAECMRWSLAPRELLGLLAPGTPVMDRPWHTSLYLGAAPLALAGVALANARADGRVLRLALVSAPCLLYALGDQGPLQPWLWELGLSSVRYPAKAFLPVALALALLAGIGLDRARASRLGPSLALCVVAVGAAAVHATGRPALHAIVASALLAGLCTLAPVRRRAALIGLVTLLDLGLAARGTVTFAPRSLYTEPPALLAEALEAARGDPAGPLRVLTLARAWTVDWPVLDPRSAQQRAYVNSLFPNTTMPHGLRTAVGFSSFASRRARQLMRRSNEGAAPTATTARFLPLLPQYGLYCALDADLVVYYLFTSHGRTLQLDRAPLTPWATLRGRAEPARDEDEAIARVLDRTHPAATAIVEGFALDGPDELVGTAHPVVLDFDRLELDVEARRDGVLVVNEAWGRGWTATVDGAPAAIYPADALYRAVPVPPGRHRVVMEYTTPGRTLGLALGALSLLALVVAAARERRA